MQDEQPTTNNTTVHLLLPSIKLICIGLIQFYGIIDIPLLILMFFLSLTITIQTYTAIYFFSRRKIDSFDVRHAGYSLNKWIMFPMITNIAAVYQIFLLDYVFFAGIAAAHIFILTGSQLILVMKGSNE
jgi:hypothetical protein